MTVLLGGCLCGKVRYNIKGSIINSAICHCPSCRKASGAPIVGWAMVKRSDVDFDRDAIGQYESSTGALRSFCPNCGTTLFFEGDYLPGMIDITTESLDNPDEALPTLQIWCSSKSQCVRELPNMQCFDEFPPQE